MFGFYGLTPCELRQERNATIGAHGLTSEVRLACAAIPEKVLAAYGVPRQRPRIFRCIVAAGKARQTWPSMDEHESSRAI
jgi:hypothetical protein